jgi:hypothetical protein
VLFQESPTFLLLLLLLLAMMLKSLQAVAIVWLLAAIWYISLLIQMSGCQQ